MSKDGLRRLPDHVVAPLLRALMTIRHRPESRLYLRKCVPHRIHMTKEDYRVFASIHHDGLPREEPVGNIRLDSAPETLEAKLGFYAGRQALPWLRPTRMRAPCACISRPQPFVPQSGDQRINR